MKRTTWARIGFRGEVAVAIAATQFVTTVTSPSSPAPAERPRTLRPRRGGRLRVRGGRAAAVEDVVAVVPVNARRGRGRGRGRGGRGFQHERPGPHTVEGLQVRDVEDMPQGHSLETALHPYRERSWLPSDVARPAPGPPASPSPAPASDLAPPPPSPSPCPSPPPAPRRYCRNLDDTGIEEVLNYGSDPGSDDSGDDEENVAYPSGMPRMLQAILDTPLDVDLGGGDEVPVAALAAAPAEDHDVPLMVTDQPWRWYDFNWESCSDSSIRPESRREPFSASNVGPTAPRDDPYAIFLDIWDCPIMEYIASETNSYAQQVADQMWANNSLHPNSRIGRWFNTTADELYIFFGLMPAMGVVVKFRLEEYWSSASDVFCTPGFSTHMSIDRFILLNKCLHFSNNNDMCGLNLDGSEARLFKIQPILSHLNKKFQALYTPSQNIALDESFDVEGLAGNQPAYS